MNLDYQKYKITKDIMENKSISKMNKKELYEKCMKQQEEIQKLTLFQDYHEDIVNDYDGDADNLLEEIKNLKRNLKSARERCKTWCVDEYNRGYKEASDLENEKQNNELVKMTNDHQMAHMLLMENYITKGIEKVIDEGDDQYTIDCGTNFYKEYKLKYIEEHIIPYLTQHNEGKDDTYSSYKNGNYYYKHDCMCPYEFQHDNSGTMLFNREETDSESDTDSDSEEEES